jgi:hypothetical protein
MENCWGQGKEKEIYREVEEVKEVRKREGVLIAH